MSAPFPASYSTLSATELARFVSAHYELPVSFCRLLVRGVGDTYLLEGTSSRFVLRVYRNTHRTLQHIIAEVGLLIALHKAGVSVSFPLPDKSGGYIQTLQAVEGNRHAVVFSYAAGQSTARLTSKQLANLGTEIGKFHAVSSCIQLPGERWRYDTQTTLYDPLELSRAAFNSDPEGLDWLCTAVKRTDSRLQQLGIASFPRGYIHFDFLPKNFHVDENDRITFFDFDFLGYGPLIHDLAIFWQHLCLDVSFNRQTQQEADESFAIVMNAYRTIRPVSDNELAAIPWLSLGFWLYYMGFHTTHDQFYPLVYEPAALKMRIAFLRKHLERYWE